MWFATAKSFLKSLPLILPERLCLNHQDCRMRQKKSLNYPLFGDQSGSHTERRTEKNSRYNQAAESPKAFLAAGKTAWEEQTQFARPDFLRSSHSAWRYFSFRCLEVHPPQGDKEASISISMGYSVDNMQMPARNCIKWEEFIHPALPQRSPPCFDLSCQPHQMISSTTFMPDKFTGYIWSNQDLSFSSSDLALHKKASDLNQEQVQI